MNSRISFALRVDGIPLRESIQTLHEQLKNFVDHNDVLAGKVIIDRINNIASRDSRNACTTVTVGSYISAERVIEKLSEAGPLLPYRFDDKFYGITPLYDAGEDAKFDVIAVPGLGSHAIGSWKSSGRDNVWLRDYLPIDIPNIRVLLYGYDTSLLGSNSKQSLQDLGISFLETVKAFRSDNKSQRPIIFIGHSLGGLLIKEALIRACTRNEDLLNKNFFESCHGILFFGVPNLGLRNHQLMSIVQDQPNETLIRDLVVDRDSEPSPYLKTIRDQFSACCKDQCRVVSFFELKSSPTVLLQKDGTLAKNGPQILMVTEISATNTGLTATADEENICFNSDHSGLVKFRSSGDSNYKIVVGKLRNFMERLQYRKRKRSTGSQMKPDLKLLWNKMNQPPYSSFRNSGLAKPVKGSLLWLLRADDATSDSEYWPERRLSGADYALWLESAKSQKLVVSAPPGRGKSVSANFIVDHLLNELPKRTLTSSKLIYYFCNIKNDEASRNAASIVRAFIVQLCETDEALFRHLPFAENDADKFFSMPLETLLYIFENMLNESSYGQIFCVIDGLDVYKVGMETLGAKLVDLSTPEPETKGPVMKLLCTTRPQKAVLNVWNLANHRILCCDAGDLDIFIESRIKTLGTGFTEGLRKSIADLMRAKKETSFLWLDIVLKRIKMIHGPTSSNIQRTFSRSPEDLDVLYEEIIEGLVGIDKSYARLLTCVYYARQPLSLDTLLDAVAIDPNQEYTNYLQCINDRMFLTKEDFYDFFGTILEINRFGVCFIHQSVKDYLERSKHLEKFFGGFSPRLLLAYITTAYLSLEEYIVYSRITRRTRGSSPFSSLFKDIPELEKRSLLLKKIGNFSLFDYASRHWHAHIENAADVKCNAFLEHFVRRILDAQDRMTQAWLNTLFKHPFAYRSKTLPSSISPFEAIVGLDIGWIVEWLLDRLSNDEDNWPDIHRALDNAYRSSAVLEILMKHEQAQVLPLTKLGVLKIISHQNFTKVKHLFDTRGSEIEVDGSLLEAAVKNRSSGQEIFAFLIKQPAAEDHINQELMSSALKYGNIQAILCLIERPGLDVHLSEEILKRRLGRFFSSEWEKNLCYLLDSLGNRVQMTRNAFLFALRNAGSSLTHRLFNFLGPDPEYNEDMIIAAMQNRKNHNQILTLLLAPSTSNHLITERVLISAVRKNSSSDALKYLLDFPDIHIQITEAILKAAVLEDAWSDALQTLLIHPRFDVEITEEVLKAAANKDGQRDALKTLLDHPRVGVEITEEVVKAAIRANGVNNAFQYLLERPQGLKITSGIVVTAIEQGLGTVRALFDHSGGEIRITDVIIEAVIAEPRNSVDMMRIIANRRSGGTLSYATLWNKYHTMLLERNASWQ